MSERLQTRKNCLGGLALLGIPPRAIPLQDKVGRVIHRRPHPHRTHTLVKVAVTLLDQFALVRERTSSDRLVELQLRLSHYAPEVWVGETLSFEAVQRLLDDGLFKSFPSTLSDVQHQIGREVIQRRIE